MKTLRQAFGCIVGYSDHTLGDHIACAAIANGAKVIEKHYTFDKNASGPDHQFAIEPNELKAMIDKIREIEYALGDGIKNGPREEELEMYNKARRSILASKDLAKGDIITEGSLVIKRPGLGMSPLFFENLIGMKLNSDIKIALEWFELNSMVANPEKFQIIFLGINDDLLGLTINNKFIKCSNEVKLLGLLLIIN